MGEGDKQKINVKRFKKEELFKKGKWSERLKKEKSDKGKQQREG